MPALQTSSSIASRAALREELRDRGGERRWAARGRSATSGCRATRGRPTSRRRPRRPARAHAPTSGRNDGTRGQPSPAPSSRPSGEERAEVGRLHRARSATGGHGQVARRARARGAAASAYAGLPALERVTAHHADQVAARRPTPPAPSSIVVVVQRQREGVVRAGAAPRPGVGPGVEGVVVARRVVELARGVERRCGRCRRGCRGSRAARAHPHGVRRRRRRRRTCSPGTAHCAERPLEQRRAARR